MQQALRGVFIVPFTEWRNWSLWRVGLQGVAGDMAVTADGASVCIPEDQVQGECLCVVTCVWSQDVRNWKKKRASHCWWKG